MRYIGIDYGKKRVGIAISDLNGRFALPHSVLPNDANLVGMIKKLCDEFEAAGVVIGESRDLNGRANEIMSEIKIFKASLEAALPVKIYLEPEFYTSAEAQRIQGKTSMHDASAAALILKSYIERHDHGDH